MAKYILCLFLKHTQKHTDIILQHICAVVVVVVVVVGAVHVVLP